MKPYPTIPQLHSPYPEGRYYVWDKLDGSCIRVEFNGQSKQQPWRFGRRHGLLDDSNPLLPEAEAIIRREHLDGLALGLASLGAVRATAYFEFYGQHSFAGAHRAEPHQVVLFDVAGYKRGILAPRDLLEHFSERVPLPKLLYQGELTAEIVRQVREGTLDGVTFEGVVAKSARVEVRYGGPRMFKFKSQAWLDRLLHERCGGDRKLWETLR